MWSHDTVTTWPSPSVKLPVQSSSPVFQTSPPVHTVASKEGTIRTIGSPAMGDACLMLATTFIGENHLLATSARRRWNHMACGSLVTDMHNHRGATGATRWNTNKLASIAGTYVNMPAPHSVVTVPHSKSPRNQMCHLCTTTTNNNKSTLQQPSDFKLKHDGNTMNNPCAQGIKQSLTCVT